MAFLTKQKKINAIIPDNSDTGLVDAIRVFHSGSIQELEVNVNIAHPYNGDLELHLTAPSGKSVKLHKRSGKKEADLKATFKGDVVKDFIGEKASGDWKLTVKDFAPRDEGTLKDWSIKMDCTNSKESEIFIPDGADKKLVSKQMCLVTGVVTDITVKVDIQHAYIGDLKIALVSPSGKEVVLHNRAGHNKNDLIATYTAESLLKPMVGEKCKGVWALVCQDLAPRDAGRIRSWHCDLKVS
jgi:subtilisin-like proprotein convertase family protein